MYECQTFTRKIYQDVSSLTDSVQSHNDASRRQKRESTRKILSILDFFLSVDVSCSYLEDFETNISNTGVTCNELGKHN